MTDSDQRMQRALLSLDGLTTGDAFGEMMSVCARSARQAIEQRGLPRSGWWLTDDSQMAMAIVETLARYQRVVPDALATRFAKRYEADTGRGYGKGVRRQMEQILAGGSWRVASAMAFSGRGSMGNGAAMRVAPLGAYFADDMERLIAEARASAAVTHSHPEGIAGAVAVALASGVVWRNRTESLENVRVDIWQNVLAHTPRGETWDGLQKAAAMPVEAAPELAARVLGSGFLVTAPDTVPYTIWCAARHLDDYADALLSALEGDGDCDTNCAIVGGIVALYSSGRGVPKEWLESREPLDLEMSV